MPQRCLQFIFVFLQYSYFSISFIKLNSSKIVFAEPNRDIFINDLIFII